MPAHNKQTANRSDKNATIPVAPRPFSSALPASLSIHRTTRGGCVQQNHYSLVIKSLWQTVCNLKRTTPQTHRARACKRDKARARAFGGRVRLPHCTHKIQALVRGNKKKRNATNSSMNARGTHVCRHQKRFKMEF